MNLGQPAIYDQVESVDPDALMIWQEKNPSGDPFVPAILKSMSMESLIAQVSAGGLAVVSPLNLTMGVLSIEGITGFGAANQVVVNLGTAWGYQSTTGTGNIVRAGSPAFTGTVTAASLTATGNLQLGNSGSLVGLFGATPVAQPSIGGTAFPNPVTDTAAFLSKINQLLSNLLEVGIMKV